jgi:hypothetical protein
MPLLGCDVLLHMRHSGLNNLPSKVSNLLVRRLPAFSKARIYAPVLSVNTFRIGVSETIKMGYGSPILIPQLSIVQLKYPAVRLVRSSLVFSSCHAGTTQRLHSTLTVNWVTTILSPTLNSPKMW